MYFSEHVSASQSLQLLLSPGICFCIYLNFMELYILAKGGPWDLVHTGLMHALCLPHIVIGTAALVLNCCCQ